MLDGELEDASVFLNKGQIRHEIFASCKNKLVFGAVFQSANHVFLINVIIRKVLVKDILRRFSQ